jgi:hypothetical protein
MDHQPTSSQGVDCSVLSPGLRAIVTAMAHPGQAVDTLAARGTMPPLRPADETRLVILRPTDRVTLMGERRTVPEKGTPVFAGVLSLTIPSDGFYRISAGAQLWIEVMDGDTKVERIKTKRLHCGPVQKSLVFSLQAGSYWLELSESQASEVLLTITPEAVP